MNSDECDASNFSAQYGNYRIARLIKSTNRKSESKFVFCPAYLTLDIRETERQLHTHDLAKYEVPYQLESD
jgi:hypothetical protein